MTSIIDAIDGALQDWETSPDAMRWSPRLAEAEGRAVESAPPATVVVALDPAVSVSGPGGPWLTVGSFADGTMRLLSHPGTSREELSSLSAGILALAGMSGSFSQSMMRAAIEEQERQVREVLMRGTLPLLIDGEPWPPPPPAPASGVLGPVPGDVARACEEAASRGACWPCRAKTVPPQEPRRRKRRLR